MILESSDGRPMLKIKEFKGLPVATPTACALGPRTQAWLSRYRRLNIVFDRAPDLFAAHIWIAMISIISRRLVAQAQAQQGI